MKHVYFAQNKKGEIKIGHSGTPVHRIMKLGYIGKEKLKPLGFMVGGLEREREIQFQFRDYCIQGEWFEPHPDLLAFIEQNTVPEPIKPKRPKTKTKVYFIGQDMELRKIIATATGTPIDAILSMSIDITVVDDE